MYQIFKFNSKLNSRVKLHLRNNYVYLQKILLLQ